MSNKIKPIMLSLLMVGLILSLGGLFLAVNGSQPPYQVEVVSNSVASSSSPNSTRQNTVSTFSTTKGPAGYQLCGTTPIPDCYKQRLPTLVARDQTARAEYERVRLTPFALRATPVLSRLEEPQDYKLCYKLEGYEARNLKTGATSVWQLGGLSDKDQTTWYRLYALSYEDEIMSNSLSSSNLIDRSYEKTWNAPQHLGDITITSATGIRGILTFTSSSGHKGTFDMALEKWAIQ